MADGVTTRAIMTDLRAALASRYQAQLRGMLMKKATQEAAVSGFNDGFNNAILHLTNMGVIELVDPVNGIEPGLGIYGDTKREQAEGAAHEAEVRRSAK